MNTTEIKQLYGRYVMPTYAPELALVRGKGTRVWDAEDREYLDFLSGISVSNLGHCHPALVRAIKQQAARLMHVSNLYYNENQPRLAQALSERSLGGKCFFCNSGAEANEALIKLARLWGRERGKHEILTMNRSFHGRTLATLAATGQQKVKNGFAPLPEGFVHAELNQLESCEAAMGNQTAAILVEAVQGEGGVVPATAAFMKGLRALCDEQGALLLCDEVQCGMGRTGRWFGYQHFDVQPDAIALAKGLGGGFPIGAIVTAPPLADVFQPGHHASTFGGTPLACAAALAVIDVMERENLLERAAQLGRLLMKKLEPLARRYQRVTEIRGLGLMVGIVLDRPAKGLERLLTRKGLLTLATAENVIRLLPPLNVKKTELSFAARLVEEGVREWDGTS